MRPNKTPTAMTTPAIFNFIVKKEDKSITVERSFNAPLAAVWSAWTEADILCKWWAPRPWECIIQSLDFRVGGSWRYYMQGPEGDRHYCRFDYTAVKPKSSFSGFDGFCDEHGTPIDAMPRMNWENNFNAQDGSTVVRVQIGFNSEEDLEKITAMGFKEGFTQGLDQLEELLASNK